MPIGGWLRRQWKSSGIRFSKEAWPAVLNGSLGGISMGGRALRMKSLAKGPTLSMGYRVATKKNVQKAGRVLSAANVQALRDCIAAIERKNLLGAEECARGMGVVSLDESLALVCLVAEIAPERLDGFARRWVARLADERTLTLAELDLAVTALRALPSFRARKALRAFV